VALRNKPIDANAQVDARVTAAITLRLEGGHLPCAAAWEAAGQLGVEPSVIGTTADQLRVHLSACQLGFFGPDRHAGETSAVDAVVSGGLAEALLAARGERGEMSCARLWQEAARFGVPRLEAGALANRLHIKVRDCDLGAF
jgi:hypothetical protein